MTRYALIRDPDGTERSVPETTLVAEKDLHDVLTSHPELLPADDLEVGQTVVVGRESSFDSGYADLVLVDAYGQICLVEIKKEGNPDTRRVIAQLLDYAAALWQMSIEDFERTVLHPYLRTPAQDQGPPPDIATYVTQRLDSVPESTEAEDGSAIRSSFAANLEQTLTSGHFRLVVAAPSIPPGVEKVIEYLNAQGHLIYGLEVSFFGGATECFVPNLVVKPRVSETRRIASRKPTPIEEADFLQAIPDRVRDPVERFLRDCEAAGAQVRCLSSGASIRVAQGPERVIAFVERGRVYVTVTAPAGYPAGPFQTARDSVADLKAGGVANDGWQYSARYAELGEAELGKVFWIALKLVSSLMPAVEYRPLEIQLNATFDRNDHNIWAKSAPDLSPVRRAMAARNAHRPRRITGPGASPTATRWQPRMAARVQFSSRRQDNLASRLAERQLPTDPYPCRRSTGNRLRAGTFTFGKVRAQSLRVMRCMTLDRDQTSILTVPRHRPVCCTPVCRKPGLAVEHSSAEGRPSYGALQFVAKPESPGCVVTFRL